MRIRDAVGGAVRVQTAGIIVPASKGRVVGERCIGGDEVVERGTHVSA
jgi:hypothetical protein